MTPEELASNSRKEENAKIREHAMWDAERGPSKKATTDQFQCGKCRQRKCTYYVRSPLRISITVYEGVSESADYFSFCLEAQIWHGAWVLKSTGSAQMILISALLAFAFCAVSRP